jgi:hypothetical protein
MDHPTLSAVEFRDALAQMRAGKVVTAADLMRVAEYAHCAADDAELELDHDEADLCREIEADARGALLAIPPTPVPLIETGTAIAAGNAIAWGLVYAAAMGWLP